MRFRFPVKIALVATLAFSAVAFLCAKGASVRQDSTIPVVFGVSPANPGPNSQVFITVQLDGPTPTGQVISIGCTDPSAFVHLPEQIVVPAGESSYTFEAQTSSVFTEWVVLAATANGGTALAVPR